MQKIAYVAPMVFVSASSMLFAGTSFIEAVAVGAVSGAVAGAAAGAAVWAWNALFGPGPAPPKD